MGDGFIVKERGTPTARADFACLSKRCLTEDGEASVYELPVGATHCPSGHKRLKRIMSANIAHGVATRTDKIVEPQYVVQQQRHDKAVETQRESPMFAVPINQLGATLAQFGGGISAPIGQTSRPTPGISNPVIAGVKAAGAIKPANVEWVNRRVDRNDQWKSTGGSGR